MEQKADNRDLLIRYLLGKLNDAEQQEQRELAERFFEDDDLFDELLDVESELMERYVCGELAPDEKAAFAGYIDNLPDGRDKVAFTTALRQVVMEKQAKVHLPTSSSQVDVESRPVSLWKSLTAFIQRPPSVLRYALAATFVFMAIGMS